MKTWFLIVVLFVCGTVACQCRGQGLLDLNIAMMRSTFKIEGGGSIGTAFIMGNPTKNNALALRYVMITAAHVLEGMKGDTATLHLRKKEGDAYSRMPFTIKIKDGGTNLWIRHPDADVAAMHVSVPTNLDIDLVSTSVVFADDDFLRTYEIHAGDELFALGFPLGAEANEAGFPILRGGTIASYPLLPTRNIKTFLFDFKVYRGNSGGPVLIYQMNRLVGGKMPTVSFCRVMGLVSQEKLITEQIASLYENRQEQHPLSVAVVVHATLIQETIALLDKDSKK